MVNKNVQFLFFCYILIISLIGLSYKCEIINLIDIQKNFQPGIYYISSKKFGQYNNLIYRKQEKDTIYFSNRNKGLLKNIRFIPIKNNESIYYIEFIKNRKKLGLNESDLDSIILYDNISNIEENNLKLKWKIFNINNDNYIIQNIFSRKFWRTKGFIYLDCGEEIPYSNNIKFINDSFIDKTITFKITKLYEELSLKKEHIGIIEKEPIDILIKYINLSDPLLKRDGIKQIKKDEDNGEIKYSLRSIFKFIPWIRKVFILMPNEKVNFLKPINEIKNRIIYIKDKDILGFDSESSTAFQYVLYRLKKYGISDNFLLMDDDYFIGREMRKNDFFYFDENLQKVVPIITTMYSNFYEEQKNELINNINFSLKIDCNDLTLSHTPTGWKATKSRSLLFLMEQLGKPLINGGFDHNTIPVNINDIEEIYNLIYLKYKYSFLTLNSITRTKYDLQYQTIYTTYALNKLKRKVRQIYSKYYDVKNVKNATLGVGLFCINTGFREYKENDFDDLKLKLDELFPEPTIYEKISDIKIENKTNNNL